MRKVVSWELHEEGGSGAHAKFTGLPCLTLLRRNSGDNSFHEKQTMNTHCPSSISERILSFPDMWDVDHPVDYKVGYKVTTFSHFLSIYFLSNVFYLSFLDTIVFMPFLELFFYT